MADQKTTQGIPIVFLTDNTYAIPTAVAIQSLIDRWAGAKPLRIYVIVHEVCDDYRERLKQFCSEAVHLELIDSDWKSENLSCYYDKGSYVTATSMLKFCIPRLLPQDDKILYLDGDILVQKDLSPLTEYDISDYYVGAIEDLAAEKSIKLHDIVGVKRYFNSGILLLNAKRFRDEDLEKTMFEIGREHPEYMCRDQSVFNKGFQEQVLWLSPEWNLMMYNLRHANYSMLLVNTFYGTEYESLKDMERQANIIHLTNKYKPWVYEDAYCSDEWLAFYRQTPFADLPIHLRTIDADIVEMKKIAMQNSHVVRRLGFITKDWSPEETAFSAFGKLFANKVKQPVLREVRLFGIQIYRERVDSEHITASVLGVRFKKRENLETIANEVDERIRAMIREKAGVYPWAADDLPTYFAFRQLDVLDLLKARWGKQA